MAYGPPTWTIINTEVIARIMTMIKMKIKKKPKMNVTVIRRQLDRRIDHDLVRTLAQPRDGWIRTIRLALGMRIVDLASRLGVSEANVRQAERSETKDSVTLRQLRKMADAMDCDLVYGFVPRTSLEETVADQIERRAKRDAYRTADTMSLEKQDLEEQTVQRLVEDLTRRYQFRPPRDLWRG